MSQFFHEAVKGECAQYGSVVATDRNYGRPFTTVTVEHFALGTVEKILCECCNDPRDPRNEIAQKALK